METKIRVYYKDGGIETYNASLSDMDFIRKNCLTNPLFAKTLLVTKVENEIRIDEINL